MLTPEDVSNKRFTPVRLREGYDMGEVDQFLDEVEAALKQRDREIEELKAKVEAAQTGEAAAEPVVTEQVTETETEVVETPAETPAESAAPAAAAAPVAAAGTESADTVPDAYNAAARLLEIATRNADELVEGAKDEADKIIGEARTKAERLETESKQNADKLEADARGRSQLLDSETADRRRQLFGDLERERDTLAGDVENLRAFEREYRSRLKAYFTEQLEALGGTSDDGTADAAPATGDDPAPQRLKSILGDD